MRSTYRIYICDVYIFLLQLPNQNSENISTSRNPNVLEMSINILVTSNTAECGILKSENAGYLIKFANPKDSYFDIDNQY